MKAIICREFKNYMKNPLYWLGIVILVISIYSSLSEYLDINIFSSSQEVEQLKDTRPTDADVMNGYIPTTSEEQIDIGLENIKQTFIDTANGYLQEKFINWSEFKTELRGTIASLIYKETRRSPIIIPVLISTDYEESLD